MSIPCPRCQHAIVPGQRFCAACGTTLLLELTPGLSSEPACAVHPRMRSLGTCERCGAFACARCLRLGATGQAICERCQERERDAPLPWDRREELGTLKAFWKTCVEVLLRPQVTFSAARTQGSVGSSLLFSLLCSLAGMLTSLLVYMVIFGLFFLFMPTPAGAKEDPRAMFPLMMVIMFVFWGVVGPLLSVAHTVVSAAIDHVVLRLAGATRGFQVTLRANALSQAPYLLGLIPLLGMQVAPFWTMVARVFAYRGLHQLKWGPAVAGALVAPVLGFLLCGGAYLAFFLAMMRQLPPR